MTGYTVHKTCMVEIVVRPAFRVMAVSTQVPIMTRRGFVGVTRHAISIIGMIKSIVAPT